MILKVSTTKFVGIRVRFQGPTDTKPARWVARSANGHSFTFNSGRGDDKTEVAKAVKGLLKKMGWKHRKVTIVEFRGEYFAALDPKREFKLL